MDDISSSKNIEAKLTASETSVDIDATSKETITETQSPVQNSDDSNSNNTTSNDTNKPSIKIETKSGTYNRSRVKELLIRIAKAAKRHQIRMHAHKQVHEHIDKIKEAHIARAPKSHVPNIEKDIEELKNRVTHLVSVEKNPNHPDYTNNVNNKIALLEAKLEKLVQTKESREARFKELEDRIQKKISQDAQLVNDVEKQLLQLEKKLLLHQIDAKKSKKKTDAQTVHAIREKIQTTKSKLEKIKNSKRLVP